MQQAGKNVESEKILLQATLCLLIKDGTVLLARKMKKIGAGLWNGYGGGIELGESVTRAALRELKEEADIISTETNLEKVAVIEFDNITEEGKRFVCTMHVFLVHEWMGDPKPSDEMTEPTWFKISELPISEMLPADQEWLPKILSGKKIMGTAYYAPRQKSLRSRSLWKEINEFPKT